MQSIHGRYRSRDNDTEYEYDGSWHDGPIGLSWDASVWGKGQAPSHPAGVMTCAAGAPCESLVRAAIENAIERRGVVLERRVAQGSLF